MPIQYSLKDNHFTSDPDDYYPQVEITQSADLDAVAERMAKLGSTVTLIDIVAVLKALEMTCLDLVLEGKRVNFGNLVDIYPRMTGTFEGLDDEYDPARHKVGADASVSARFLKQIHAQATVQKLEASVPTPAPLSFTDVAEETTNTVYTPGGIGTLVGARLKFNPAADDEGIYFINTQDQTQQTKVSTVAKNKPSQLMFMIPPGVSGSQYIEVRARIRGGDELRTGRLRQIINEI